MATNQDCPTCCPKCSATFCNHYLQCNSDCCGGCCTLEACLAPNLDLRYGQALAYNTALGVFDAYDPAGVDGLNKFVGILKYSVHTDENGNIFDGEFNSQFGLECPKPTTCMYYCGEFCAADLTGNLEAIAASGDGKLIGDASTGVFLIR